MSPLMKFAFLFVIGAAVSFSIQPSSFAQDEKSSTITVETEVLGEGLYAFRYGQKRSYFVVSASGVIVTDPLSVDAAKAMKQEIRKITAQPVTYVAYSTSLFQRSEGAQVFKEDGAEIVAQARCALNLSDAPNPDVVPPDTTFDDSSQISVGSQTVALYALGRSYGSCYTVIVARNAKVILLPDLVTPPRAALPPDPTIANYFIHRIVPAFEQAESIAAQEGVDRVAGGAADDLGSPTTAPVALIGEQRAFWEKLLGAIDAEAKKGTPARTISSQLDMSAFAEFDGFSERNIEIMTRRVYSLYRIGR